MPPHVGPQGALIAALPAMPAPSPCLQGQSAFADDCEQLYAADQYEQLLDKFVSALDVVLAASTSDQGAPPPAAAGLIAAAAACRPALQHAPDSSLTPLLPLAL